nr:hypothetical protein [Tanacetum cinerariifolium]
MNPRGGGVAGYMGAQNRVGNVNMGQTRPADDCDAFDSDVDEAPTAQTKFMANLSSVDHVTGEARPLYDLDILSEVQDHDHYQDTVCAHHEEYAMHDSVQLDRVVDSHADYTSDSVILKGSPWLMQLVDVNISELPNCSSVSKKTKKGKNFLFEKWFNKWLMR